MRLLSLAFAVLLVLIQYPLWLGDGGWLKVWERERKLADQLHKNDELRMRNAALEAEVRDLRDGTSAMEERARFELGMVRADEIFVQILDRNDAGAPSAAPAPNGAAVHAPVSEPAMPTQAKSADKP